MKGLDVQAVDGLRASVCLEMDAEGRGVGFDVVRIVAILRNLFALEPQKQSGWGWGKE